MNHKRETHTRGLTRRQQKILLWLPLIGFWLLLLIISKQPEGGRDWASFAMLGVVGSGVYVGMWFGLMKVTAPKPTVEQSPEERLASGESRASLIYGGDSRQADSLPEEKEEE